MFRKELLKLDIYHINPLQSDSIISSLYTDKRKPAPIELEYIKSFFAEEEPNVIGGLLCLQRIRNNLFHGPKDAFLLPLQKNVIQSASDALGALTKYKNILAYQELKKSVN